MYENGYGVGQDYTKAVEWYRKGAEAGDARGMYFLGWNYLDGIGVAQDSQAALKWFTKASEDGLEDEIDENKKNMAVQGTLNSLGYECGIADGVIGEKTRNAVRRFCSDHNMPESDVIDLELMRKLVEVCENS